VGGIGLAYTKREWQSSEAMLGKLILPDYEEMIEKKDWQVLREAFSELDAPDLAEILEDLPPEKMGIVFRLLPRDRAAEAFEYLPLEHQTALVQLLAGADLANILNEMAPDDRTRLFEELPAEVTKRILSTLSSDEVRVARALLGYPENSAGRFMTPEYMALKPDMNCVDALAYIRQHGKKAETLNVVYVVDDRGHLLEDLKLATLVLAKSDQMVGDIGERELVSIPATMDREDVVKLFEKYDRVALPVTDSRGILLGIITVDDVLDVATAEATEDIQRLGGMEPVELAYLDVDFTTLVRKRAGWLAALFIGEMFTATAMTFYENEIAKAVVLSLFMPLIISSGGNSGSQATSLIIRSLALGQLTLRDWWRVAVRELFSGFALGSFLACIGVARIIIWGFVKKGIYGPHFVMVALTVGFSLIGVVTFGSLSGSMLPFLLRRLGMDPATASAPFVATLSDVTGLVIYFSVASLILTGVLL
jgi:magnesium transporter